jgi:hypothetical protein
VHVPPPTDLPCTRIPNWPTLHPERPTLHLVGPKRPTLHRLAPPIGLPYTGLALLVEPEPVAVQVGPLYLCTCVRASEPIFSFLQQNEFCGIRFSTLKPAGPCTALCPGRWVYEKELVKPSLVVKIEIQSKYRGIPNLQWFIPLNLPLLQGLGPVNYCW